MYWSELIQKRAEGIKKGEDDEKIPKKIGTNHPISDFKEMLNYRNQDLFETAVQ